ncbi:LacI family DNA-binding transcriptional regulator [Bifidobacterium sp. ESL0800]|uniref:LacI family DNA-binding transcriptional regulator n=1 Tax=Bifidobacterium sp. ESL0800 TaxID=2983236 RepID=UPI0023F89E15|nr:LacI family DNA-binding transcriptional regulator [Bifidobacterium sp. ESL0800]WEV75263.1 LacI family DNA-binding transcriptional regulator [Bifidobacterium sp. ESL0800]
MRSRVTIKDVAKEAGVSIKTVSNALNGTGSMRPSTRERVLKAMHNLGYTVNVSARSLKTGSSKLIGLAVFDFLQPFSSYLANQIIDVARERGYGVIVSTYASGGPGIPSIIEETYRLGADGWIFFTDTALADEAAILSQPYPTVLAGDYSAYGKADLVTMPNVDALEKTTGDLLDRGYRSVALVGAPADRDWKRLLDAKEGTQELRIQGYARAFERRGLEVDWSKVISVYPLNSVSGVQAGDKLLEGERPDAVVCLDDALAFGMMNELQRHGCRIPEDIAVVGFDNVPEGAFSTPRLTTIDPHTDEYARKAVEMLIERIEGYSGAPRTFVSDFSLIERDSTKA